MIYCDSPTLETWRPPPNPPDYPVAPLEEDWTKLIVGDVVLSNSTEYADWSSAPVWPIVCERCYAPHCGSSGLAHIVRLPDQVLWVRPTLDELDRDWRDVLGEQNLIQEPVVLPRHTWEDLTTRLPQLPRFDTLRRATRTHLARLWFDGAPAEREPVRDPELFRYFVEKHSIASDPMDQEEAVAIALSMIDWLTAGPSFPVNGRIVRRREFPGRINTIYFRVAPFGEWQAFAVWTRTFVLDEEWVFMVES